MIMVFIMGSRSYELANLLLVGFLCMLTITGFSMAVGNSKVRCVERERQALLNFKESLVDEENTLSSWGSEEEDCCRWRGIGCNNRTGRVIRLVLHPKFHHYPYGDNPGTRISGVISPSLLELQYLTHLDLSLNSFEGIPEFIGSLSKLTYLNLSDCLFYQPIPHQIGNLSSLQYLDLTENDGLSTDNLEWLSRLSSLRVFEMSYVNLSGAAYWLHSIQKLPSLSRLMLYGCQLPEIIPSSLSHINSSKSLAVLDLVGNSFGSSIFSWLFNFTSNLVDLRLYGNDLKGPIPDSFGDMVSLAHLDLSSTQLEGGIPKSLGDLCNLQSLDLSRNNLREELPRLLGNLTGCTKDSLEILMLSTNSLSGSFPDVSVFSSLRELYLDGNQLDGSFPKSFVNLSKLIVLNLKENQLIGSLPEFTKFPSLQELYLDGNQLEGPFPRSFGQLSSLRILDVSSNSLDGVISEAHLLNLSELQQLDLSFNSLALNFNANWVPPFQLDTIKLSSCNLGPHFPSWLQTQKRFSQLDISNSKISDGIPNWFWPDLSSKLRYLNLSFNNISGVVPNLTLKFDYFPGVDLSSNLFSGPIPSFLARTAVLNLSKNLFSGFMSFLCTMMDSTMTCLNLSDNLLSGRLPNCWMPLNRLVILNLENNNLSGIIPSSMGSLVRIETLRLRNNTFSGNVPPFLKNCTQLKLLDLGENKFSGKIPAWIWESSTSLIVLRLRSNEFNGNIPLTICHLRSLQVLDLSLNNISGSIPPCVNNFTAMTQEESLDVTISYGYLHSYNYWSSNTSWNGNVAYYVDSTFVMWKGIEREYKKTLGLLKLIDLSSNKLTGEIPGEVTSLLGLLMLNISRNNLTGIIPKKIGQLNLLESIDFSKNQLHGEIPQSLANLSYLGYLDLSDNNLSGKIPLSTQLQGFNASAYVGNPQLCGPPLLSKCPGGETILQDSPNTSTDENIQEGGEWFRSPGSYASMALGFIVGFWGVCGTLLFNRSWRHAYYQFLNDMWAWFFVTIAVNIAKLQRRL